MADITQDTIDEIKKFFKISIIVICVLIAFFCFFFGIFIGQNATRSYIDYSLAELSDNINEKVSTGVPATGIITIQGEGEVLVDPDYAWMDISYQVTDEQAETARIECSGMISDILEILQDDFGLKKKDIKTTEMSLRPQYGWIDNVKTLEGQKASQSIHLETDKLENIPLIYDVLSQFQNLYIDNTGIGVRNEDMHMNEAREKAIENAMLKAQDYAKAAGLQIIGIKSISNPIPSGNGYKYVTMDSAAFGTNSSYNNTEYMTHQIRISDKVEITVSTAESSVK